MNSDQLPSPHALSDDHEKKGSPIPTPEKKAGRRKINIEFIEDKSRRHITFSKRKAGIMKKAYELSTLTGTQVLLLVASETGHVYTFATPKLQPLITKPEGKNLIQTCLNAPDPPNQTPATPHAQRMTQNYQEGPSMMGYPPPEQLDVYEEEKKEQKFTPGGMGGVDMSFPGYGSAPMMSPSGGSNVGYGVPPSVAGMAQAQARYLANYAAAAAQYSQAAGGPPPGAPSGYSQPPQFSPGSPVYWGAANGKGQPQLLPMQMQQSQSPPQHGLPLQAKPQ